MIRTYGHDSDRHSDCNTVIEQSDPDNYIFMVADINENGPKSVQYIHWISTKAFQISEILCFAEKRLNQSEITEEIEYIPALNGPIKEIANHL